MKAVELFCGIGCSAYGLVQAGIEVVGAVDLEPTMVRGFNSSGVLPRVAEIGDVADWTPPDDFDLVCAGPTCKAFSPGASLFGSDGANDERNAFPHLMVFLDTHRPRYALIENTYGLARFQGYLNELIQSLSIIGYWVTWYEIDAYDYGVPQHRKRVVMLCSQSEPWEHRHVRDEQRLGTRTVGDALRQPAPSHDPVHWELVSRWSERALAYWRRDPRHEAKHPPLQLSAPATTVVANYKRGIPYGVIETGDGLRRVGPRLAARLQGLPDSFRLGSLPVTRAYEGIGNGFPPQVVAALVANLPGVQNGA